MTQSDKAAEAADHAVERIDPQTVIGWGVDADPDNDPTWPMRDRTRDDGPGLNWTRPPLQQTEVEILQSVEHLRRPAVVGLATPPSGPSGAVRRIAFKYSESQWGHWLLLMLADRINAVEGVVTDVVRGRPPNLLVETGSVGRGRATQAAVLSGAAVLAVATVVILARRRR